MMCPCAYPSLLLQTAAIAKSAGDADGGVVFSFAPVHWASGDGGQVVRMEGVGRFGSLRYCCCCCLRGSVHGGFLFRIQKKKVHIVVCTMCMYIDFYRRTSHPPQPRCVCCMYANPTRRASILIWRDDRCVLFCFLFRMLIHVQSSNAVQLPLNVDNMLRAKSARINTN